MLTALLQSQLQPAQYFSHPAITRYFDHVQNRPSVRQAAEALAPAFSLVTFDLENAPKQERKAEPPKKKEKAPPAAAAATTSDAPVAKTKGDKAAKAKEGDKVAEKKDGAEKEGKAQKKEKKAKEPKEPKAAEKKPAAEDAGEPVPSMIDLRVGHIVDSKPFRADLMSDVVRLTDFERTSQEAS